MVTQLRRASQNIDLKWLNLHAKDITVEKLHDKSLRLVVSINKRFHEIIWKIQEGWMVYVSSKKLKKAAKNLKNKNSQKQRKIISIDNPHLKLYDKNLTSEQIAGIQREREWVFATNHFYDTTKPPLSFHWYAFYAEKITNEGKRSEVVACIYEFAWREYILLDKRIAQYPISGNELVDILKRKYKEVHDKYNTNDGDIL
jgi:hypothetical protein